MAGLARAVSNSNMGVICMAKTKLITPKKKQVFQTREELVEFMTNAGWQPEGEGTNPNTKELGNGFRDTSSGAWIIVYSSPEANGVKVTDIRTF